MTNNKASKQKNDARISKEIERRRALGELFTPLQLGANIRNLCEAPWGQAWNRNLTIYSDYADRLTAARKILRAGGVYDLTLTKGEVFAYVTEKEIFEVLIHIDPMASDAWQRLCAQVGGQVENVVDVLSGNLSEAVMAVLAAPERGLFPTPTEIHLSCDCPDWADMCQHVAAALYGVGVLLDAQPELFFVLRGVNPGELVAAASAGATSATELEDAGSVNVLQPADLSRLFGIELSDPESAFPEQK